MDDQRLGYKVGSFILLSLARQRQKKIQKKFFFLLDGLDKYCAPVPCDGTIQGPRYGGCKGRNVGLSSYLLVEFPPLLRSFLHLLHMLLNCFHKRACAELVTKVLFPKKALYN